jgi:hypothetical protein
MAKMQVDWQRQSHKCNIWEWKNEETDPSP